jgi:hypothetical protein
VIDSREEFTRYLEAGKWKGHDSPLSTVMIAIKPRLSSAELEHHYETAAEPTTKRHFHALWAAVAGLRH